MALQWRQHELDGHMRQQATLMSRKDPALSAAAVPGWAEGQLSGITGRHHHIKLYSCGDLNGSCICAAAKLCGVCNY